MKSIRTALTTLVVTLALTILGSPTAFGVSPSPTPTGSDTAAAGTSASAAPTSTDTSPTPADPTASPAQSETASTTPTDSTSASPSTTASPTPSPSSSTVNAAAMTPLTPDVPTMYINLPAGYGLDTLNGLNKDGNIPDVPNADMSNWSTVTIVNGDGSTNMATTLFPDINAHGNFTWTLPKKSYDIKFNSSTAVLGMAKAKSWVLLANYTDGSLLRDKTAYDAAVALGLPGSTHSAYVNLVINGAYLGNYQVCEKVQVNKNRLNLTDPEGMLLEMDNNYGTSEDYFYYASKSGSLFVVKDSVADFPTPATQNDESALTLTARQAWLDARNKINAFENELYKPNPDWSTISSMIDVDSFLKVYFVQELAANPEITQSSVYFYMDGPNDKIHAGPVWDFDSSFGAYVYEELGGPRISTNPNYNPSSPWDVIAPWDYVKNAYTERTNTTPRTRNNYYDELFQLAPFAARANTVYANSVRTVFEALPNRIQGWADAMQASANLNFQRWPILGGPSIFEIAARNGRPYSSTYQGEVDYLKVWVANRTQMFNQEYVDGATVLQYQGYVSGVGWQNKQGTFYPGVVTTAQITGTVGQSRNLEAVKFIGCYTDQIQINTFTAGWTGFNTGGQIGSPGSPFYGVQLQLTGDLATYYDIYYRVHAANIGWGGWVANGGVAGAAGGGNAVQAMEIKLMRKGGTALPANGTGAGGYVPVCPNRILDTRNSSAVAPHGTFSLQVLGNGGVPMTNVSAVVMNVTSTASTAPGDIRAYPSGTTLPTTSNLNFFGGQTVANLVTVKVGADGKVALYNDSAGSTHLIADIVGYYVGGTPAAAGAFVAQAPSRLLDTRQTTGPLASHASQTLQIVGAANGIPSGTSVSAVVLNVTSVEPTSPGWVSVTPNTTTNPTTSSLNFNTGDARANSVTAKVSSGGSVSLYNGSSGTVQLIVDLAGYYIGGTATTKGMFVPVDPTRVLDTRYAVGISPAGSIKPNTAIPLNVGPASARAAVVMNVTVTGPTAAGWVAVYPSSATTAPLVSNLNYVPGDTYPNMVISKLGADGNVKVLNGSPGLTDVVADLSGYFLP